MDMTPRLRLPYIAPQQAQKQVTYDEAMRALDMLVQPVVNGVLPLDDVADAHALMESGEHTGKILLAV